MSATVTSLTISTHWLLLPIQTLFRDADNLLISLPSVNEAPAAVIILDIQLACKPAIQHSLYSLPLRKTAHDHLRRRNQHGLSERCKCGKVERIWIDMLLIEEN